ncbi:MAG: hypothetical protein ACI8Q1_001421 [Parvicella sp.]|jgi:hypothetical protein
MKRLILLGALLISYSGLFAQTSYYYKDFQKDKVATFQVSAGALDYDGLKYGYSIGVNVKDVFSINYFHTRDYVSTEGYQDSRLGGFNASMLLPVGECVQLGGGVRTAWHNVGFNRGGMRMIYTGEMRANINESLKLAFEFGGSKNQTFTAVRLLFNLY